MKTFIWLEQSGVVVGARPCTFSTPSARSAEKLATLLGHQEGRSLIRGVWLNAWCSNLPESRTQRSDMESEGIHGKRTFSGMEEHEAVCMFRSQKAVLPTSPRGFDS